MNNYFYEFAYVAVIASLVWVGVDSASKTLSSKDKIFIAVAVALVIKFTLGFASFVLKGN